MPRVSWKWRLAAAAAWCGSRILLSSICREPFRWRVREPPRCFIPELEFAARTTRITCNSEAEWRAVQLATHGHNEEGWNRGRCGAYHDLESWRVIYQMWLCCADPLLPPCRVNSRSRMRGKAIPTSKTALPLSVWSRHQAAQPRKQPMRKAESAILYVWRAGRRG